MTENVAGPGWEMVRPKPSALRDFVSIDDIVPDEPWLWSSLQRVCVPDCCGLDAYDFSHRSVRWACGDAVEPPEENEWRHDHPGDPLAVAAALRAAAASTRHIKAEAVSAALFNDILTPESYALLFEDLATKLEQAL
jgi:hypothetical protein